MPRENFRSRARRKAHHDVRAGLDVDRRAMTEAERDALVEGVHLGAVSRFGAVKLSALRLDERAPLPPWLERARGWTAAGATLTQLAALRRRDAIVLQLVRAGACPFERSAVDDDHGRHRDPADDGDRAASSASLATRTRAFLADLKSPHAAWLVAVAVTMRHRAILAGDDRSESTAPCDACVNADGSHDDAESNASSSSCGASLRFRRCGHTCGERCAWRWLVDAYGDDGFGNGNTGWDAGSGLDRDRPPCDAEWFCPTCGAREVDEEDHGRVPKADEEKTDDDKVRGGVHREGFGFGDEEGEEEEGLARVSIGRSSSVLAEKSARAIAAESRRRWLACDPVAVKVRGGKRATLAAETRLLFDPNAVVNEKTVSELSSTSSKFRATGPAVNASRMLGTSRPRRTETLLAAARAGDARRVLAVVDAGVDVDATDEYGLTAVTTAAWRGRARAVEALLRSGADAKKPARGGEGVGAAEAAEAGGHATLAARVRAWEEEMMTRDNASDRTVPSMKGGVLSAVDDDDTASNTPSSSRVETLIDPASFPSHPGANWSFRVDGAVPEDVLRRLDAVAASAFEEAASDASATHVAALQNVRGAKTTKPGKAVDPDEAAAGAFDATTNAGSARSLADTCADRAHFCDVLGWARRAVLRAARRSGMPAKGAHPQMRVLRYRSAGGIMAPHVDLAKRVEPEDARGSIGEIEPSGCSAAAASTHTFLLYLATCDRGGETALLASPKAPTGAEGAAEAEALADVKPTRGRLLVFPHECPHAGRPVVDAPKVVLRGELWM